MNDLYTIIKKCQENCGSQRMKAPGDKGYFCGLSYEDMFCSDMDPTRTHKFGFGPEYKGCKLDGIMIHTHKKERAVYCPKRR